MGTLKQGMILSTGDGNLCFEQNRSIQNNANGRSSKAFAVGALFFNSLWHWTQQFSQGGYKVDEKTHQKWSELFVEARVGWWNEL
jgi:hypothetical protein